MKTDTCGKVRGIYGNHIHKYWKRVAAKAERRNAKKSIWAVMKT